MADRSEVFMLPPTALEPSEELSRLAVEHFLDYEKPPDTIKLHPMDNGRWAAIATWTSK